MTSRPLVSGSRDIVLTGQKNRGPGSSGVGARVYLNRRLRWLMRGDQMMDDVDNGEKVVVVSGMFFS